MAKYGVSVWIAFFTSACAATGLKAGEAAPEAPTPAVAPMAEPAPPPPADGYQEEAKLAQMTAAPAPAEGMPDAPARAPAPSTPGVAPQTTSASAGTASSSNVIKPEVAREMLDIQASLQLKVDSLNESIKAIHGLASKHHGTITEERLTAIGGGSNEASLTLRVPSGASDVFFDDLRRVGEVLSQQISVRDVGKEFHDAGILLRNLEATMKRYEEILQKANNIQEIMQVEAELGRLRAQIDQVKGNLRWLADRAARATVQISLRTDQPQPQIIVEEPEARFYPGVRGTYLGDYQADEGSAGYIGAGLSLRFTRALSIDIDGLRNIDSHDRGIDVLMVTGGGEFYSEFLGDGKRRWLNPYLGLRAGYSRFLDTDQAVLGTTLGVEIFKTDFLEVDADVRLLGFFFGKLGAHAAIQPAVGVNVAF